MSSAAHTVKSYQRGDRVHVRAQQVWLILIHYAANGNTVTYGELAELMGYGKAAARATIKPLAIVARWCQDHSLPLLNSLVVSADTGEPGDQVILNDGETADQAQERAFHFDWFSVRPPSTGKLRTTWEEWE